MKATRNFISIAATRVAWLPAPAAGFATERVVAVGGWSEDEQANVVALFSLSQAQAQAPPTELVRWTHEGAVTDVQAISTGSAGEILLLVASSAGTVSRLRLQLPPGEGIEAAAARAPAAPPRVRSHPSLSLQLLDDDGSGACRPWLRLGEGEGEVASCDCDPHSPQLLLASSTGLLALHSLDGRPAPPAVAGGTSWDRVLARAPDRLGGYACARWGGRATALSAGVSPGLAVWDVRASAAAGAPALRCAGVRSSDCFCALASLPSAPHYVAGAGECTAAPRAAVWDLRKPGSPLEVVLEGLPGGGPAWCLAFDAGGCDAFAPRRAQPARDAFPPSLLVATEGGCVAACAPGAPPRALAAREPAGVSCLALEPSYGGELVAVTQGECLLYWAGEGAEVEEEEDEGRMRG